MNNENNEGKNVVAIQLELSEDLFKKWEAFRKAGLNKAGILRLLLEECDHSDKIRHLLFAGGYPIEPKTPIK